MKRISFKNNHYYHIYNRGADKRRIFLDNHDYLRFVRCLYNFNDTESVLLRDKIRDRISAKPEIRSREKIIEIICFCLMPNHFHLILRQIKDGGISDFLQKLGIGYTMYFNTKYERTGVLFQGKFKAKHIEDDSYLIHLSRYIHLNPISLTLPDWTNVGIKGSNKAEDYLKQYRWSSYLDYVGIKNFPAITERTILSEYFETGEKYRDFINDWTGNDFNSIKDLAIDG